MIVSTLLLGTLCLRDTIITFFLVHVGTVEPRCFPHQRRGFYTLQNKILNEPHRKEKIFTSEYFWMTLALNVHLRSYRSALLCSLLSVVLLPLLIRYLSPDSQTQEILQDFGLLTLAPQESFDDVG